MCWTFVPHLLVAPWCHFCYESDSSADYASVVSGDMPNVSYFSYFSYVSIVYSILFYYLPFQNQIFPSRHGNHSDSRGFCECPSLTRTVIGSWFSGCSASNSWQKCSSFSVRRSLTEKVDESLSSLSFVAVFYLLRQIVEKSWLRLDIALNCNTMNVVYDKQTLHSKKAKLVNTTCQTTSASVTLNSGNRSWIHIFPLRFPGLRVMHFIMILILFLFVCICLGCYSAHGCNERSTTWDRWKLQLELRVGWRSWQDMIQVHQQKPQDIKHHKTLESHLICGDSIFRLFS